jgi:hypothetical protein
MYDPLVYKQLSSARYSCLELCSLILSPKDLPVEELDIESGGTVQGGKPIRGKRWYCVRGLESEAWICTPRGG